MATITDIPVEIIQIGLTKREYFAAMAMQGYIASTPSDVVPNPIYMASHAVKYADALINELNKEI